MTMRLVKPLSTTGAARCYSVRKAESGFVFGGVRCKKSWRGKEMGGAYCIVHKNQRRGSWVYVVPEKGSTGSAEPVCLCGAEEWRPPGTTTLV